MPRYSFEPPQPDYPAASLAHFAGAALTHAKNPPHLILHGNLAPAFGAFAPVQQALLRQPYKVFEAQVAFWSTSFDLWHSFLVRFMGLKNGDEEPLRPALPQDPRFQHPAWSENLYFDFLRQSYLITSHWAESLIDQVDGLDPHTEGFKSA